jgi:hypothetical protein
MEFLPYAVYNLYVVDHTFNKSISKRVLIPSLILV